MRIRIARALALLAALGTTGALHAEPAAFPRIDIRPTDGGYTVEGTVVALAGGSVEATLDVSRSEAGNESRSRQSTEVEVAPGEEAVIGRLTVSAGATARLDAILTISAGGVPVSRSQTSIGLR